MGGLITTKEAAGRLNISVRRVQALIAAGRLPAQRIGNSFAIREGDLKLVGRRMSGRPTPTRARTQKEWNRILDECIGSTNSRSKTSVTRQKNKKISISKKIIEKPPYQRSPQEWDAILDKVLGSVSLGPSDLSTNKKYMEGFGRENAYRR